MTIATSFPPHGRLMSKLTAIGPYLREKKSQPQRFFFDCLASCVNAEKAPELREFWGWWLVMTATDSGYEYEYDFGRFNAAGEWANGKLPAKHKEAVLKTLVDFYSKLTPFVVGECELTLVPAVGLTQVPLAELSTH